MFPIISSFNPFGATKIKIWILYGSSTGNSEEIAKQLRYKGIENRFDVQLKTLNECVIEKKHNKPIEDQKKEEGKKKEYELADFLKDKDENDVITDHNVIIVCSTTGDGEPPENAQHFWNFIRNRNLPKDLLKHLNFVVLALGDSNYRSYCAAGKFIDNRLEKLGALRMSKITYVDAVGVSKDVDVVKDDDVDEKLTGMEVVVEPFKNDVWKWFKDEASEDNQNFKSKIVSFFIGGHSAGSFSETHEKAKEAELAASKDKTETTRLTLT